MTQADKSKAIYMATKIHRRTYDICKRDKLFTGKSYRLNDEDRETMLKIMFMVWDRTMQNSPDLKFDDAVYAAAVELIMSQP